MQEKSSPNTIFFHNLRFLIHKSGLKDSQVAEAIGIHKGSLSRYFGEQRIPKKAILNSLATFFRIPVTALLHTDLTQTTAPPHLSEPPATTIPTTPFPTRLRTAIKASGLTQRELASKLGVSEISISRWCSGIQTPSRSVIFMLASILNTTISHLIGEPDSSPSSRQDNTLPTASPDNWKQRALAAEAKLQHLENIIHELFTFAKIK